VLELLARRAQADVRPELVGYFAALVPLYAQERRGISALGAGTLLTAHGTGMIAVAAAASMALRRTGTGGGMFRQSGAITAVSVTTAVIARSAHPGIVQAHVFIIFGALLLLLLLLMLPLVKLVPDHHGNW
jgi:hypothetical protein